MVRHRSRVRWGLFAIVSAALLLFFGAEIGPVALGGPVAAQQEESQFFPKTGQTLRGGFLRYWWANGGVARFGYPVSGEFDDAGPPPPAGNGQVHRVQYLERARFEYHAGPPGAPERVLLGLLGHERLRDRERDRDRDCDLDCDQQRARERDRSRDRDQERLCFSEPDRCLTGPFLRHWRENGGLERLGYPISGEFRERNMPPPAGDGEWRRVQYTERARLGFHEQFADSGNEIMLGLLGRESYRAGERAGA